MPTSNKITVVEDIDDTWLINLGEADREISLFVDAVRAMPDLSDKLRSDTVSDVMFVNTLVTSATPSAQAIRKAGRSLRDSIKGTAADTLKNHSLFDVLGISDKFER